VVGTDLVGWGPKHTDFEEGLSTTIDWYRANESWWRQLKDAVEATTEKGADMADFAPTHPGEILAKEFLEPIGITPYRLAKEIGVPQTRLSAIIGGRRGISADTGLRLSRALGLSDMFWINLQARYDADVVRINKSEELEHIHPLTASTS
jgi:addiction module HigA family antidote